MRTATLARPHRRTACAGGTLSRTLSGERRTWTLEDRFAALGQSGARRRRRGSGGTRWCSVHGPRTSLRNDQATLRHNRLAVSWRSMLRSWRCLWDRRSGRNNNLASRSLALGRRSHCRGLNLGLDDFRRNFYRSRRLLFDYDWCHCHRLLVDRRRHGRRNGGWRCNRRFRWNHNLRGLAHYGLRSNQARRRLRRFNRSRRSGTGCGCDRLGNTARRTRRHSGRRSHAGAWRRHRGSRNGTRRNCGLGGLLRNRLQHVTGLGDVREVNLGLELFFGGMRSSTRRSGAEFAMLGVILPDALRLVHFNGAGVRLLLRDSDLDE